MEVACACNGTGWKPVIVDGVSGVTSCECRIQKINDRWQKQIDPRFINADLETVVPINASQEIIIPQMRANAAGNFFLFGPRDRGKTHLLASQFAYLSKRQTACYFRTAAQLVDELYAHYLKDRPDHQSSDVLAALKRRKKIHLFIDDIDKVNLVRTDFRKEAMFTLIDGFYRNNLGLSVTTNKSPDQLRHEDLLDSAVVRRIEDMCSKMEFV